MTTTKTTKTTCTMIRLSHFRDIAPRWTTFDRKDESALCVVEARRVDGFNGRPVRCVITAAAVDRYVANYNAMANDGMFATVRCAALEVEYLD